MPSILRRLCCSWIINFVLNLVISGMPSILGEYMYYTYTMAVLNLVISGMPSMLKNPNTSYVSIIEF